MGRYPFALFPVIVLGFSSCTPEVRDFDTGSGGGGSGGSSSSSSSSNSSSSSGSSSSSSSSSSSGGDVRYAFTPVAPAPDRFMWQGMQHDFRDDKGQPCTAHVAIAVGPTAVCYAAANGALRCAGSIYQTAFGPSFVDVEGIGDVDQILMSYASGICVRTRQNEVYCMGDPNNNGQFGNGTKDPSSTFTAWGPISDVQAIATGTWDQICGMTGAGLVLCSGYNFDILPKSVGNNAVSLWVSTFGEAKINDGLKFRAANSRTDCTITSNGLECFEVILGPPSDVVDGTFIEYLGEPGMPLDIQRYCFLESAGHVVCRNRDMSVPMPVLGQPYSPFNEQPILALAGNFYSNSLCVVHADGSIACMGRNDQGQLGLPPIDYVEKPSMVQPPGSVDTRCE